MSELQEDNEKQIEKCRKLCSFWQNNLFSVKIQLNESLIEKNSQYYSAMYSTEADF